MTYQLLRVAAEEGCTEATLAETLVALAEAEKLSLIGWQHPFNYLNVAIRQRLAPDRDRAFPDLFGNDKDQSGNNEAADNSPLPSNPDLVELRNRCYPSVPIAELRPLRPEPPTQEIVAAMADVPRASTESQFGGPHLQMPADPSEHSLAHAAWLAFAEELGQGRAAAEWAIYRLVETDRLYVVWPSIERVDSGSEIDPLPGLKSTHEHSSYEVRRTAHLPAPAAGVPEEAEEPEPNHQGHTLMGSLFKRTERRPVPQVAGIIVKDGKRFARWKLRGKTVTAEIVTAPDGTESVGVKSGVYFAKFRDHNGRPVVRSTGCRDELTARQKLAGGEKEVEQIRAGVLNATALETARAAAGAVESHLTAYEQSLIARDVSAKYRENLLRDTRRLIAEVPIISTRDLRRELVEPWFARAITEGMKARTRNR